MKLVLSALFSITGLACLAQQNGYTLDQAIETALQNNGSIKASIHEAESQAQLRKTSFDLPKTSVALLYGQYNGFPRNDNNITVTQTIPFTALGSLASLNKSLAASAQMKKAVTENDLIFQVKTVFNQLSYAQAHHNLLLQQDSILERFLKSATARYKAGEANLLEQTTAETQWNELRNQLHQNEGEIFVQRTRLKTLMGIDALPYIEKAAQDEILLAVLPDTSTLSANPTLAYERQQVEVARSRKKLESAKFAPDLQLGFFTQTLIDITNPETGALATKDNRFTGFQVGLALPLWFVPHMARVKASESGRKAAQTSFAYYQASLQGELQQAVQQYLKNKSSIDYYRNSALPGADLILRQSQVAFRGGDIGYIEYLLAVRSAINIKERYQNTLNEYNQSVYYIEYLLGIK